MNDRIAVLPPEFSYSPDVSPLSTVLIINGLYDQARRVDYERILAIATEHRVKIILYGFQSFVHRGTPLWTTTAATLPINLCALKREDRNRFPYMNHLLSSDVYPMILCVYTLNTGDTNSLITLDDLIESLNQHWVNPWRTVKVTRPPLTHATGLDLYDSDDDEPEAGSGCERHFFVSERSLVPL